MAQESVRGEDKVLIVASDSSFTTPLTVAGIQTIKEGASISKHDVGDAQSGQWNEHRPGRTSVVLDLTMLIHFDGTTPDPGQSLLLAYLGRSPVWVKYRPNGSTVGAPQKTFKAHIYSPSNDNPNDGEQTTTIQLESTGTVTTGVVP